MDGVHQTLILFAYRNGENGRGGGRDTPARRALPCCSIACVYLLIFACVCVQVYRNQGNENSLRVGACIIQQILDYGGGVVAHRKKKFPSLNFCALWYGKFGCVSVYPFIVCLRLVVLSIGLVIFHR